MGMLVKMQIKVKLSEKLYFLRSSAIIYSFFNFNNNQMENNNENNKTIKKSIIQQR